MPERVRQDWRRRNRPGPHRRRVEVTFWLCWPLHRDGDCGGRADGTDIVCRAGGQRVRARRHFGPEEAVRTCRDRPENRVAQKELDLLTEPSVSPAVAVRATSRGVKSTPLKPGL